MITISAIVIKSAPWKLTVEYACYIGNSIHLSILAAILPERQCLAHHRDQALTPRFVHGVIDSAQSVVSRPLITPADDIKRRLLPKSYKSPHQYTVIKNLELSMSIDVVVLYIFGRFVTVI